MRLLLWGLVGGLTLALPACGGPKTYPVSGTVTYDGEPLPDGYIAFLPEGPGPGGGGPIANGQYSVRAQPGKNRVEITASKMMRLPPGQVGMDGAKEEVRQYIPERYNAKTELMIDIPTATPRDFHLNSK